MPCAFLQLPEKVDGETLLVSPKESSLALEDLNFKEEGIVSEIPLSFEPKLFLIKERAEEKASTPITIGGRVTISF